MREARTPHEGCGTSRERSWRHTVAGVARALSYVVFSALMLVALAQTATAKTKPP